MNKVQKIKMSSPLEKRDQRQSEAKVIEDKQEDVIDQEPGRTNKLTKINEKSKLPKIPNVSPNIHVRTNDDRANNFDDSEQTNSSVKCQSCRENLEVIEIYHESLRVLGLLLYKARRLLIHADFLQKQLYRQTRSKKYYRSYKNKNHKTAGYYYNKGQKVKKPTYKNRFDDQSELDYEYEFHKNSNKKIY